MATVDSCKKLANQLRSLLREGIYLSREDVEFIDSTYSSPNKEELLAILNGEPDADRDTLLELLFTPDESFQGSVEPILTHHRFLPRDETRILGLLRDPLPEATFLFPDAIGRVSVKPPGWVVENLLAHLHISWQPPPPIAKTVANSLSPSHRIRAGVRLRNLQADLTEPQVDCLCRYMSVADSRRTSFFPNLEFLARFLGGLGSARDIYESLMARKAECWAQLERALKQEKALAENNLETLLLRGERILNFDKDGLMQDIAAIDDIGVAVFGKTEARLPRENAIHFGEYPGREDLERLIKLLS